MSEGTDTLVAIASDALSATISPLGAELQTLRDADGRDLLSDGPPAFWTGRAPLLFPIVGRLIGDHYRLDGQSRPMHQHGFARQRRFEVVESWATRALLRLDADDETRAAYPFDFRLDVEFSIAGAQLSVVATVTNRGGAAMPASFGYHPAFRWPLPDGGARADHVVRFAEPEPGPIRRLAADGGVAPEDVPTPIEGDMLHLRDDLFVNDAIIMDQPRSRSVHYGVPGRRGLRIGFPDMPMLGIWTKPGAPFLCIEPWHGHADPEGFAGELWDKPGIIQFAPGESRTFTLQVAPIDAV